MEEYPGDCSPLPHSPRLRGSVRQRVCHGVNHCWLPPRHHTEKLNGRPGCRCSHRGTETQRAVEEYPGDCSPLPHSPRLRGSVRQRGLPRRQPPLAPAASPHQETERQARLQVFSQRHGDTEGGGRISRGLFPAASFSASPWLRETKGSATASTTAGSRRVTTPEKLNGRPGCRCSHRGTETQRAVEEYPGDCSPLPHSPRLRGSVRQRGLPRRQPPLAPAASPHRETERQARLQVFSQRHGDTEGGGRISRGLFPAASFSASPWLRETKGSATASTTAGSRRVTTPRN